MNSTPQPPEQSKAPESVGWYIELTKWLIGIGAGVLVFGFDKVHLWQLTSALRFSFWVSAGLIAISIGFGILCCMQFLAYANRKESGAAANETADDVAGYRKWGTIFYQLCAGPLWVGIVIFALVWAISVMGGRGTEGLAAAPVILTLPEKTSALLIQPEAAQGATAMLVRDKDGKYSWQTVQVLAPLPTSSPSRAFGANAPEPAQVPKP